MITAVQSSIIVAFLTSATACLLITPLVVRFADAHGLYEHSRDGDRPPERLIARLGGIAIYVSTLIGMIAVLALHGIAIDAKQKADLTGVFLAGTIIFALGLYDDIRGTRPRTKVLVQTIAALVVYAFGTRIQVITIGDVPGVQTGMFSLPLTVLWIVVVTNAFNLIDGLDGLATGIGLVVLSAVTLAAAVLGNMIVVLVALLLVGALLGFLRYNISPARIFLGDSGSLFIGFMLAVLSIHGSLKSTTAVLVAVPLFALAVPLLDTSVAILRRFLRGVPLFGADARHIHHRLLAVGLTPGRAATVLWCVTAVFAVLGLSIAFAPKPMLLGVALTGGVVATVLILYGLRRLEYVEFVEAALSIARRGGGVRKAIRDQIHARETVALFAAAKNLSDLNRLLAERASRFGFVRMEVNREDAPRIAATYADLPRLLKLECTLNDPRGAFRDELVLRIWLAMDSGKPVHGAERVATIMLPSIERWIHEHGGAFIPRSPQPDRRRLKRDAELPTTIEVNGTAADAAWRAF